jgi:NAD(P)-dependent dehydrogenase (short-subunit alcohol dehydrogenase family)
VAELRFDGQVAVITGAGGGLGRAYAHLLASRGASVVVNDPGVGLDGAGGDEGPARATVREIENAGGVAIANFDPVGSEAAAESLLGDAIDAFGRIDIVINNAGIFTPRYGFEETSTDSFERLFRVHVMGTVNTSRAAWPYMRDRRYGKIINITSSNAYLGSAGRLEYSTAKGAVHGFTKTLAKESLEYGIYVNAVAPGALTRPVTASTRLYDGAEFARPFAADLVAPTVVWLAHPDTHVNGEVFTAVAGTTAQLVIGETYGFGSDAPTPEDLRDNSDRIFMGEQARRSGLEFFTDASEGALALLARFGNRSELPRPSLEPAQE